MNKLLIIVISLSSLICQVLNQSYGTVCSCSGFSCGTSGTSNGLACWYNCCWMTMRMKKNTILIIYNRNCYLKKIYPKFS